MFFNDAIFADSFYVMFGNCKIDYFLVGSGNLCIDADGDSIKNSTECIDATKKVGKFLTDYRMMQIIQLVVMNIVKIQKTAVEMYTSIHTMYFIQELCMEIQFAGGKVKY